MQNGIEELDYEFQSILYPRGLIPRPMPHPKLKQGRASRRIFNLP